MEGNHDDLLPFIGQFGLEQFALRRSCHCIHKRAGVVPLAARPQPARQLDLVPLPFAPPCSAQNICGDKVPDALQPSISASLFTVHYPLSLVLS